MVLYPNKLPESERVCSGICMNGQKIPAKCPDSFRNRRKEVVFKVVADPDEPFRKC